MIMFLLDLTSEQDTSLLNEKIKKYQISSISMMFAFHYMLESQSKFENFVFFFSKISKTNVPVKPIVPKIIANLIEVSTTSSPET